MSSAKVAAESGQVKCGELRETVIRAIEEAGGRVDYAEVLMKHFMVLLVEKHLEFILRETKSSIYFDFFFFFFSRFDYKLYDM